MVNGLLIGIGIGILSSLIGIGGGPVLIPVLLYVYRLEMTKAAGTSLAVVIPTALVALLGHWSKGHVNFPLSILLALGGMMGAVIGSFIGDYVSDIWLRKGFALVLLYIALRTLLFESVS